jgi:outer membrane biosynthesis protein TonB
MDAAAAEAATVNKAATVEKAVTVEESAMDAKSAKDEKKKSETSGFLWLVLIAVAVFGAAYLAVHFLKDSRFPLLRTLRGQQPPPAQQPQPTPVPQTPPAPAPKSQPPQPPQPPPPPPPPPLLLRMLVSPSRFVMRWIYFLVMILLIS